MDDGPWSSQVYVRASTEQVIKFTVLAETSDGARLGTLVRPNQLEKYWLDPSPQQDGVGVVKEYDGPSEDDDIQAAFDNAPAVAYKRAGEVLYMSYMRGAPASRDLHFE